MNRLVMVILSLSVVAALATTLGPVSASADEGSNVTATKVKLSAAARPPTKGVDVKGQFLLSAIVTTADGKPVSDRPVKFYQQIDFFGRREAMLGTATTDSTGTAVLLYQTTQPGRQTISAHFPGGNGFGPTDGSLNLDVRERVALFDSEPLPFASVSQWLPIGVGVLVLGTWTVLLGVFVSTALGIRATSRPSAEARQPAAAAPRPGRTAPSGD